MNFKNIFIISIILMFGCTNKDDEARKLGFSDATEMQSIKAKGYENKSDYNEAEAKRLGFESVPEMFDAEKIKGIDPIDYILDRKWSLWNNKCDPLGETYMVFTKSEAFGFYVVMKNERKTSKQKADHEFKKISDNTIWRVGRIYARGNDLLEPLVDDPETVYTIEQKTTIKLITPGKIKITTIGNTIDLSKLLKFREVDYDETTSEATSVLCESEDQEIKKIESKPKTTASSNFLIGSCTWEANIINPTSCDPKQISQKLKIKDEIMSYSLWGDKDLKIRILGRGVYKEIKVPVKFNILNNNTIEAEIEGQNRCITIDRYKRVDGLIAQDVVSQTGGCDEEQKAAFRIHKSRGVLKLGSLSYQ